MKYVLLLLLTLAMGFNTWVVVTSFTNGWYFTFGMNIGWCISWAALLVQTALER